MSSDADAATRREIQLLEHNMQQLLMQRQSMQFELNELTNALNELSKTKDDVYRVMGNIMMHANKTDLQKELDERKKSLEIHMQAIERQEKLLEGKRTQIQQSSVDKSQKHK